MARITAFVRGHRSRYTAHKGIDATYYILGDGPAKLLQIDSKGTQEREMPDKVSQTIQLDRESAEALYLILQETFGFK